MVWIENEMIVRQYFNDLVEARRMAVMWLENNTQGRKTESVYFYAKQNSRNYNGYVTMENFGNGRHYYWHKYSRQYGMVQTPLYKNGKLQR